MDRIGILDDDDGWEAEVDLDEASRSVSSQLARQVDDTPDNRRFFEDLELNIDREISLIELEAEDDRILNATLDELQAMIYDKEDIYADSEDYLEEDEMDLSSDDLEAYPEYD